MRGLTLSSLKYFINPFSKEETLILFGPVSVFKISPICYARDLRKFVCNRFLCSVTIDRCANWNRSLATAFGDSVWNVIFPKYVDAILVTCPKSNGG